MSEYKSINWKDAGKGFLIMAGGTALPSIFLVLQSGKLPTGSELLTILGTALSAGLTYVFKNFFTNSENKLGTKEADKI